MDITEKTIETLRRQEEKLTDSYKNTTNQWRSGLLIFAGLAMAALGNQQNVWANVTIVLWLFEALCILVIFWFTRDIYNLIASRHFEGSVSEEQERIDFKHAEKRHAQVGMLDKMAMIIFLLATILTLLYFTLSSFKVISSIQEPVSNQRHENYWLNDTRHSVCNDRIEYKALR
jgi:hypothetical protein